MEKVEASMYKRITVDICTYMSYPIFMPVLLHSCVTVILVRSIASTTICREIQNKSNELINHIKDLPSSCTYYVLPKNIYEKFSNKFMPV